MTLMPPSVMYSILMPMFVCTADDVASAGRVTEALTQIVNTLTDAAPVR
jgi:hypothetical protein